MTDTYLASVLNVKPNAARIYLRDFQSTGLVNSKGQPTDLANAWRNDEKYSETTEEMFNTMYPDELRAAAPGPNPNRQQVADWFMHNQKLGQGAASNKAAFYTLVASGELQKSVPAGEIKKKKTKPASSVGSHKTQSHKIQSTPAPEAPDDLPSRIEPKIQLNIQIHISADATKDQIDAIFASMATHLRR
jgi:hypothetical protein